MRTRAPWYRLLVLVGLGWLSWVPSAPAQPDLSGMLSPQVGVAAPRFDYRFGYQFAQPVGGQPTTFSALRNDLSLSTPIWQDAPDEWTASAGIRNETFSTHAILPTTRQPFPEDLYNIRLGTAYRHDLDDGWVAGGNVTVGSASDQPFSTFNEVTFSANGFLRVPNGERDAWLFSLNFSTNRDYLNYVPIPGVAYFWAPSDSFQATLGIPFASIRYVPDEDLELTASYALLTNVHARATYHFWRPLAAFAGFDWDEESFLRAGRLDSRDRLFYYEKRLTAGLRYELARSANVELSGGYGFDRFFFEGRNSSDSHLNRIDIGAGPFVGARVMMRF
jgi:hypothetical protein